MLLGPQDMTGSLGGAEGWGKCPVGLHMAWNGWPTSPPPLGVAEFSSLASSMYLGVPGGVNEIVDHVVRLEVLCSLEGCKEGVLCSKHRTGI